MAGAHPRPPSIAPTGARTGGEGGNGRTVAALLLLLALLPLIALAVMFPEIAGPPVAAFLLTGVGVFLYRKLAGQRRPRGPR